MSVAVMLIHTYYGYNASGGPVGVGIAVGQAVRASLIVRRRHYFVHLPRRIRRVR
jgi:ABC-type transporter Mla maintaining outer membrane lipid asymmetry permease subunit MlaE